MEIAPNWQYFASDSNSSLSRDYIWTRCILSYADTFDVEFLPICIYGHADRIDYYADVAVWKRIHETFRARAEENIEYAFDLIEKIDDACRQMNEWTHRYIYEQDLSALDDSALFALLEEASNKISFSYTVGITLPVLDFQEFAFAEGNLKKVLEKYAPEEKRDAYFYAFTQPAQNSFAQDQEEALLRLVAKHYEDDAWREAVSQGVSLDDMKELHPTYHADMHTHGDAFGWVYYVYSGPGYTPQQFHDFVEQHVSSGQHPQAAMDAIEQRKAEYEKTRQEFINEYHPNPREQRILDLARLVVWSKPTRKDYQSKSFYHLEKVQKEIAKRLHLTLAQVRNTPYSMLKAALEGAELDMNKINSFVNNERLCIPENGDITVYAGQDARDMVATFTDTRGQETSSNVDELHGQTACPGIAEGAVRIVNRPSDMQKMQNGDILVSIATTPSIVAAMKKASAIVTDEGGLTCHAAIVSRELNIPCVIGTKIATRALKDGDKVSVDATRGTVIKL